MANLKQYAYFLKGNKIAIVENDITPENDPTSRDYGPGTRLIRYKSPTETVTNGIEIEYAYSPVYRVGSNAATEVNKFYISGWTVINGYLTFVRSQLAPLDWTASPHSAVTSGSSGNTGGQTLDYIVVRGSNKWNGLHRIQTAGTEGQLVTYTKVKETVPYFEDEDIDFTIAEEFFDNSIKMANYFNAGDYVYISGCDTALNNGLFSVDSVSRDTTATDSKVTVGTRYYIGTASTVDEGLDKEYTAAVSFTADTDESDVNVYKAYRDFCYILTDVDVLNDENDELPVPNYLSKAVVYFVKAKMSEDRGDFKSKEYFMKEFKQMIERKESSNIWGARRILPSSNAIR